MADLPTPRSATQVLGELIANFNARHQLPGLKVGGPLLSILEAAAASDVRATQDVMVGLDARNLDEAEGDALVDWGQREGVMKRQLTPASGRVTVGDGSFAKVASAVFAGTAAPIAGSTTLRVVDARNWPATGQVYVGRGTPRYEGPIAYTAIVNNGTHYSLTLASPTLRFHNHGESVILAQGGDRAIEAGTIVQVPRSSLAEPVAFKVLHRVVIPDGETSVTGVEVVAQEPGSAGNAPRGAIREFAQPPFTGATVTNPSAYSNGYDDEDDDSYRERIRHARGNRIKGIRSAIRFASVGVASPDEGRRVLSSSFVVRKDAADLLIIDDGTGYEERTAGVAIEQILEAATGGERDFQLQGTPVAKAHVTSGATAPFALTDGARLAVRVGGTTHTHVFSAAEFRAIGGASAYEVVASINANPAVNIAARTADGGTRVVLTAREDEDDTIEVVAPTVTPDANEVLLFPAGAVHTLTLYRNDRLLYKDGRAATLASAPHASWNVIAGNQTITVAVDGTPGITYTITDADFVDANTGFAAVGNNTPAAWAAVLARKLPGVTVTTDGTVVYLTSNRGSAAGASVAVTGGTLVAQRAFAATTATGLPRDYTLSRPTGRIRLETPLAAGDRLAAGTTATRAFRESTDLGSVALAATANLYATPDGAGTLVAHGVTAATPIDLSVAAVHGWGYRLRLEAFANVAPTLNVFGNVRAGDWVILWDPALPASVRGAWRVEETGQRLGFTTRLHLARRTTRAARAGHQAVALNPVGGAVSRVLVCGGWTGPSTSLSAPVAVTNTAEIYDPATQTWTTAAPMAEARAYHTATVLADGRVLVVGGIDASGNALATVEIYDPTTDTWASGPAYQAAVAHHRATRLANGNVLVTGGVSGSTYRTEAAVFDAVGNTWGANVPMGTARARHGAVLLSDGRVMVVGGETTGGGVTATAELYNAGVWGAAAAPPSGRRSHGLATYSTTQVVAVGDDRNGAQVGTYAVYTIGTNTWGADTALPNNGRFANKNGALVTSHNGNVYALFGRTNADVPQSLAWDGTSWTAIAAPMLTDTPSLQETRAVLLYDAGGTTLNQILCVGGLDSRRIWPTAVVEQYNGTGNAWTRPEAATSTNLVLSAVGLTIARTDTWMQVLSVPAGTGYTASSLAPLLAGRGLAADTYRTNRLRLRTTQHAATGGLLLAAVDGTAAGLGLTTGAGVNEAPHVGAVEGAGLGTPSFQMARILEEARAQGTGVAAVVRSRATGVSGAATLVLGRNHVDGTAAAPNARHGRNRAFRSTIATLAAGPDNTLLSLRTAPHGGFLPHDRAWLAAPLALGPGDDLNVLVDGQSFAVPLGRRLTPVGATYGTQLTFTDGANGGASLAAAFGLGFNFNDFALFMQARGLAYSADAARSMVLRYYLHGPAGERVRVRVANPAAADAPVAATVAAAASSTVDVRLHLAGGAPRTLANIRDTARIGTAAPSVTNGLATVVYVANLLVASATRDGSDNTTLTLTLPAGVTDHGLVIGDILYLKSANPNWASGNVAITARTATTVTFNNPQLGSGATGPHVNIGTVSADPQGECTFNGAGIVANDFVRVDAAAGLPAAYEGETFRVSAASDQALTAIAAEKTFGAPSTTLTWSSLGAASYLSVFAGAGQTAGDFAAAVSALAAAENATCPIAAAVLGTGAGVLTQGTIEAVGDAGAWITLADGVAHVGRTIAPALVTDNYQFALKGPVSPGLVSGAGWASEDVRLVPTTPETVVRWLSAPAVSGLFTVANVALTRNGEGVEIATATAGSQGSVQVQGGLGNATAAALAGAATDVGSETVVTVLRAAATGQQAGGWVEARNVVPAQRLGVFGAGSVLSSWTADGYMTFAGTTLWTQRFNHATVRLHWERQGRYVQISDPAGANADGAVTFANLAEGDYIAISGAAVPTAFAQVSTANTGIYRVVRVAPSTLAGAGGAIWIEHDGAVDETAECGIRGIAFDSVLPGDKISVSHGLWGAANAGEWTVEAVGVAAGTVTPQFANTTTLKVSVAQRTVTPVTVAAPALGATGAAQTTVAEGTPGKLLKRILTISPNTNGAYVDVRLDSATLSRTLSAGQGTVLYAMDKLGFDLAVVPGRDGYQESTGLVGEVNRVIYGDPTDEATYPGYVAAGADVLVQGPMVKRVTVSLLVRATSGFARADVADRVREVVAAEINRSEVGADIAISALVRAATEVQGVTAVTVLAPTYDATHDVIPVAATEKARVLDQEADISVSFVSD